MVPGASGSMASARTPGVARPVLVQTEPPSVVTKTAPGPPDAPSPTPAYSGLGVGVALALAAWGAIARARMSDRPNPDRIGTQDAPPLVLLSTPAFVPA